MRTQGTTSLPPLVERVCQTCGKTFSARRAEVNQGKGKFCSRPCKYAAACKESRRRVERTCQQCGAPFVSTADFVAKGWGKFCSRRCHYASRHLDEADFWANVARAGDDDCWFWQGCCGGGYGVTTFHGQPIGSHRLAYMLARGPIPEGMMVCHDCDQRYPAGDTSYRRCCNPAHLFLGTGAENLADAVAKGRTARGDRNSSRLHPERLRRGEQHYNTRLTDDKVREIRRRRESGESGKSIAQAYDVTTETVYFIVTRKTWNHVT